MAIGIAQRSSRSSRGSWTAYGLNRTIAKDCRQSPRARQKGHQGRYHQRKIRNLISRRLDLVFGFSFYKPSYIHLPKLHCFPAHTPSLQASRCKSLPTRRKPPESTWAPRSTDPHGHPVRVGDRLIDRMTASTRQRILPDGKLIGVDSSTPKPAQTLERESGLRHRDRCGFLLAQVIQAPLFAPNAHSHAGSRDWKNSSG